MHELPRPCYTLVPPGECVSCLFDPETNSVDLLVLVKPRCRAFNAKGKEVKIKKLLLYLYVCCVTLFHVQEWLIAVLKLLFLTQN